MSTTLASPADVLDRVVGRRSKPDEATVVERVLARHSTHELPAGTPPPSRPSPSPRAGWAAA